MSVDSAALLIDAGIRGSAVLLTVWAVTAITRNASASSRHFMWTCGVIGSLLVWAMTFVSPRWTVVVPASLASIAPFDEVLVAPAPATAATRSDASRQSPYPPSESKAVGQRLPLQSSAPPMPTASRRSIDTKLLIRVAWTIGSVAVLAWMLCGAFGAWWLRRGAQPLEAAWVEEVHALAEAFEISHPVVIAESSAATMPIVSGLWRPMIVLPRDAAHWSDERRHVVVLHELAHVKRRDCLTQAVAQLACALHWFNPLMWLAAKRLRIERERACDDFVLAAGTNRADYAAHLLDIAQSTVPRPSSPRMVLAMARPTQLEGRLLAILDPARQRVSSRLTRLASVASVLVITVPAGAVQLQRQLPVADEIDGATLIAVPRDTASTIRSATSSTPIATPMPGVRPAPTPMPMPGTRVAAQAPASSRVDNLIGKQIDQAVTEALTPESLNRAIAAAMSRQAASAGADPKAVEALIGALADPDPDVREMVVVALARMRDPRAVDALLPLLKDPNAEVREHVVAALIRTRDPRVPAAVAAMIDDSSEEVREQVVHLLGQSRNRESVPALTKALKDSSAHVREQAAFALGQVRDPSAVDPLLTMLTDPSPDVREQAVFALGQLRNVRALDALMGALKDASPDVREQAAFALSQLRDPKALPALTTALRDTNADVRGQAAFAIGQISGNE